MNPTLTERYQKATNAILLYLKPRNEPANMDQIYQDVFHGLADDHRLFRLLTAMTKEGMISNQGFGDFRIAPYGLEFMQANDITWPRAERHESETHE